MTRIERWPRKFKTRRVMTRGASVYVIASPSSGHYKIGRAKNPQQRLDYMQTGSPVELKLMTHSFVSPNGICPIKLERMLHAWLKPFRSQGEWFEVTRQRLILAWHQTSGQLLDDEQKDKLSHQVIPILSTLPISDPPINY